MASGARPHPLNVVYDPDAVVGLATAVKSKEERKAIFNAVASCASSASSSRRRT